MGNSTSHASSGVQEGGAPHELRVGVSTADFENVIRPFSQKKKKGFVPSTSSSSSSFDASLAHMSNGGGVGSSSIGGASTKVMTEEDLIEEWENNIRLYDELEEECMEHNKPRLTEVVFRLRHNPEEFLQIPMTGSGRWLHYRCHCRCHCHRRPR